LSPANIAAPLRSVLKSQRNTRVLLGEVTGFDISGKAVLLGDERVPFDTLIVAAGAVNNYFSKPEWEEHAPGLKSIEEATEIRRRVLPGFEAAGRSTSPEDGRGYMPFAVAGGGARGVEMAGAISERARQPPRRDFGGINTAAARLILVEGG